ncbi:MAG TPA: bifunctional nuclease family protein [Pyrinomonadaceae bacterium]|jgi:bifunctional DNase/RNase|nr:bifunctional nuclease family protein [Pyrinomonadaceae bacterium]
MQIEVKVGALIMDPNSSTPIVVLKGIDSEAILPIWIGAYEANAIALEIEKVVPQRPMTHDLIRNLILELGYRADKVIVSDLRENTFFASIELSSEDGSNKVTMDARPSDAIALALRVDCPIFVEQNVLDISSSNQTQPAEDLVEEAPVPDDWPDVIG